MRLGQMRRKAGARPRRVGCVESMCDPDRHHGPCYYCDGFCCSRTSIIDPLTLRRARPHICLECQRRHWGDPVQTELREARSRNDWRRATDPIDASALKMGQLPEQYASAVRAAIRAFVESDQTEAVVIGMSVSTINQSLVSLGLIDSVYAEERSSQTVLRKVDD